MISGAALRVDPDGALVRRFSRDGFATLPRITSDQELTFLRSHYDRVLIGRMRAAAERAGGPLPVGANTLWVRLDQWQALALQGTALCRNARRLAAALLGAAEAEVELGVRFFCKPARGGRPIPWHQDEAHQDPRYDHRSLNVWVPLDGADQRNGCLWFLPGSHRGDVRVHRHPGAGAPEVALATDDVRICDAVAAPLPPGGASLHHCRTAHSSGSNDTDEARRALVIVCAAPARLRAVPAARPWLTGSHPTAAPDESF